MPSRLALLFLFPKNIAVRKSLLLTTLVEHGAFLEWYILFPAGKCVDFSCFGNRILPCYRAGLHTVAQAGLELMALVSASHMSCWVTGMCCHGRLAF